MYKKVISISLVAMAAMFTGCGNDDTVCRIDVQKAIDEGRYDSAISDLNGRCANAFTSSDLNMNLAAAYMGKSGYSVSDIVDMIINSNGDGDAFTAFLSSVDSKKNANSLPLLNKAGKYFINAIARDGKRDAATLCSPESLSRNDSRVTNACLYIGFNQTLTTANTITYLTGDVNTVIDSINNDSNTTPYDMRASLDALAYVVDSNYTSRSDTTITGPSAVTIAGASFADINVTYNDNGVLRTFYRLAKDVTRDANNTTLITDGYCDVDGNKSACEGIENDDGSIDTTKMAATNCHACPVVVDISTGDGLSVAQLLVDSFNGGSDTIAAVSGDPDITSSIEDFKKEITGSADGNVTIQNIIDYLQK